MTSKYYLMGYEEGLDGADYTNPCISDLTNAYKEFALGYTDGRKQYLSIKQLVSQLEQMFAKIMGA